MRCKPNETCIRCEEPINEHECYQVVSIDGVPVAAVDWNMPHTVEQPYCKPCYTERISRMRTIARED